MALTNCVVLLPALLGLVSLLLSLVSGLWCRFAYLPPNRFNGNVNGNTRTDQQRYLQQSLDNYQVGVYFRRDQGAAYTFDSCVPYSFDLWNGADGYWRTAVVTYPVGWSVALLLVLTLFVSLRCALPKSVYRVIGYAFVLVCVPCQALAYLVMASNLCVNNPQLALRPLGNTNNTSSANGSLQDLYQDYCRLGTGGFLGIGALVGYVVTGTICCWISPNCLRRSAGPGTPKPPPKAAAGGAPPPPPPPAVGPRAPSERPTGRVPAAVSVSTQPTTFDEEHGGGPPAVVGVAAAGAAYPYGAATSSSSYASSRNRPHHPLAASAPPPANAANAALARKTIIPPHRMSYQEQRDLYSAAGHGAAIGAGAGPDTVYDVPSVVRPPPPPRQQPRPQQQPQYPQPSLSRPGYNRPTPSQQALMAAVATGAAVGARARADTSPEDAMEVPIEVVVKDENDDNQDTVEDENETFPSVPVDLDEQNDLYVAVASGSEEGSRALTDTLPAVDEAVVPGGDDEDNEDHDEGDDAYLVLPASRSHEAARSDTSPKPDPPSSWENDDDGTGVPSERDNDDLAAEEGTCSGNGSDDLRVAAATVMMGEFDESAEPSSDPEDATLGLGEGVEVEVDDSEPPDERSINEREAESFDLEEENHDVDPQDGSALGASLPAPTPTDTPDDSSVEQPDRVDLPREEHQPASRGDVGPVSSAYARWSSFRSRRREGQNSSPSNPQPAAIPTEDHGGLPDDSVFM